MYLRRAVTGEDPSDRSTWDRASLIMDHDGGGGEDDEYIDEGEREGDCAVEAAEAASPGTRQEDEGAKRKQAGRGGRRRGGSVALGAGPAAVLVLPYCFFRSRGCPHLLARFRDRVAFHHEFDTDWRQAWWHNYYQHAGE